MKTSNIKVEKEVKEEYPDIKKEGTADGTAVGTAPVASHAAAAPTHSRRSRGAAGTLSFAASTATGSTALGSTTAPALGSTTAPARGGGASSFIDNLYHDMYSFVNFKNILLTYSIFNILPILLSMVITNYPFSEVESVRVYVIITMLYIQYVYVLYTNNQTQLWNTQGIQECFTYNIYTKSIAIIVCLLTVFIILGFFTNFDPDNNVSISYFFSVSVFCIFICITYLTLTGKAHKPNDDTNYAHIYKIVTLSGSISLFCIFSALIVAIVDTSTTYPYNYYMQLLVAMVVLFALISFSSYQNHSWEFSYVMKVQLTYMVLILCIARLICNCYLELDTFLLNKLTTDQTSSSSSSSTDQTQPKKDPYIYQKAFYTQFFNLQDNIKNNEDEKRKNITNSYIYRLTCLSWIIPCVTFLAYLCSAYNINVSSILQGIEESLKQTGDNNKFYLCIARLICHYICGIVVELIYLYIYGQNSLFGLLFFDIGFLIGSCITTFESTKFINDYTWKRSLLTIYGFTFSIFVTIFISYLFSFRTTIKYYCSIIFTMIIAISLSLLCFSEKSRLVSILHNISTDVRINDLVNIICIAVVILFIYDYVAIVDFTTNANMKTAFDKVSKENINSITAEVQNVPFPLPSVDTSDYYFSVSSIYKSLFKSQDIHNMNSTQ